jgi:hypothetical protein
MNYHKSTLTSKLSIEAIKVKIKNYKAPSNNHRYYMIHSNNENQIAFGKYKGQLINLLDSVDTEFRISPSNSQNIYNFDMKFSNYKPIHYIFILFILFFIFFFNTFLFIAILSITGINFYLIYLITLFIAYYILSKKLITSSINTEIRIINRIVGYN